MPHIHTKPGQHDFTASAFIFRRDFKEPKILLHKHKLLGKYIQFGGHVEPEETPWQAIVHELREESGYDLEQLKILQPKTRLKSLSDGSKLHPLPACLNTHRFNDKHFHTDLEFAFVSVEEPKYEVEGDESKDFKLLTRAQLAKLIDEETLANVKDIALFMFDEILDNWPAVDARGFVL